MLMRFGADDIVGHRVLPDGSGVGITFLSGEDNIELLLPTKNVQGAFTILGDILVALQNLAAPLERQRVNARFPTTCGVSITDETKPPCVVLVFDSNLPTQASMAISTIAARNMGRALVAKAREAEQLHSKQPPTAALPAPAQTQDQQ